MNQYFLKNQKYYFSNKIMQSIHQTLILNKNEFSSQNSNGGLKKFDLH